MPGPNPTNNYIGAFNFLVNVQGFGTEMDGFTSCSGIKSVTEVYDFKHGMDTHMRKAAGRTSYEPVVLERVYSGLDEFAAWRDRVEAGNIERRSVIIEYHTSNRTVVARFLLLNAFPSRWETPDLNAMGSDAAIERIELSFERVLREVNKGHLSGEWWEKTKGGSTSQSYPDWVHGAVAQGPHKNPPIPNWVTGPGGTISTRTPPQRDWIKKSGPDHTPRNINHPDWVLKY